MKNISRSIILVACVAILIGSVSFVSQAFSEKEIPQEVFKQVEAEYLEAVSTVIKKEYSNAGVMLNYLRDSAGNREYIVLVHHRLLEEGNRMQEQMLLEMIQQVPLQVCDISYENHICVNIY